MLRGVKIKMTNVQKKLIDSLDEMSDAQIISLSKKALCMNIRQLLVIIAELDSAVVFRPSGPTRVMKAESSLLPDPIIITEEKKRAGRSYD